jgi:hypothetical protein
MEEVGWVVMPSAYKVQLSIVCYTPRDIVERIGQRGIRDNRHHVVLQ